MNTQTCSVFIDAAPEDIDESQLPEGWRETLEVMAAQGRFGKDADPADVEKIKEMQAREKERREKIEQKKRELIESLKEYYEQAQTNDGAELTGDAVMLSSHADRVDDILHESSSADGFIQNLLSGLDREVLADIKETIEKAVNA